MGSPPRYSEPDEEQALETHHLLASPPEPQVTYPPIRGPVIQDDDAPSVVYYYEARPPSTAQSERLMGKLFLSKEDTITMLRSAISSLADVHSSRIHFHTLINPDAPKFEQTWARVLDEVWVQMVQHNPHTLKITLEPTREELDAHQAKKDKSSRDEACVCFTIFGIVLGIIFSIGLIAYLKS